MKKAFTLFATALFSIFCGISVFAQEVLKPKIVEKLQQNVFEVVVEKLQEDPLTYERELPLDRLPYHIRMDKYDSIGTAFLLTDGHFYTAAHVLNIPHTSLLTKYFIRSSDGAVYKIGNVIKFAGDRDFVVFDVEGFDKKNSKGLQIESNPKINSSVFAVGNAQGEGIVMRNGLLTSTTPENRNGAWQWLRFSAAASPGNSGGPLVTPQGKVIGIVAMKNSSENLNYALPITEVKNVAENKGELHAECYYNIPNIMTERFYHTFDFEMDLPQPLETVRDECYEAYRKDTENLVQQLTADYLFTGKESFTVKDPGHELLNTKYTPSFPNIISLSNKGKWVCYSPQEISTLKIENNGKLEAGMMMGLLMTYLKKPDNVSVQQYIENPKLMMDTLAKIFVLTRNIGAEKITITSYNEPVYKATHTDNVGRTWLISAYNIPFADGIVFNYALPLPDGIFNLTSMRDTSTILNGVNYDFEFLSDFVIANYTGTEKEWQEYLSIPEDVYPRHAPLKNAAITVADNKTTISIGPMNITCPEDIFVVNEETEIECGIGYRPDEAKGIRIEIQQLTVNTLKNSNDNAILAISKDYKPHEDCVKTILDSYEEVKAGTIPFNGEPYEQDQKTAIFLPDVKDDSITVFGLIYKGSKTDIIKKNALILKDSIK